MLHFSFSTVLMTFLASLAVAVLIAVVCSHRNTMVCTGYKVLMIFVGIAFMRLLLPFEFPFTVSILLPQSLSEIIFSLRHPWISIAELQLSLWNFFEMIWLSGIAINLFRCVSSHRKLQDYIQKYGQDKTADPQYKTILDQICQQYKRDHSFRVMELPGLNVPILFGWKDPCIILPGNLSVPPDKLCYIFRHEILHHIHHSYLIKYGIRILSILYWWNPACSILYRCSNTLIEMYIDGTITRNDREITEQYAECLLYIRQASAKIPTQMPSFFKRNTVSFAQVRNSDLKKRLWILLWKTKTWKKIITNTVLTILILCISAASYLFILEAHYTPPYFNENFSVPTPENTYFIINEASGYDLYMNHEYLETVTSLEYYPSGIKIYNEKGVLINENE